jgi:hypothetical protein
VFIKGIYFPGLSPTTSLLLSSAGQSLDYGLHMVVITQKEWHFQRDD